MRAQRKLSGVVLNVAGDHLTTDGLSVDVGNTLNALAVVRDQQIGIVDQLHLDIDSQRSTIWQDYQNGAIDAFTAAERFRQLKEGMNVSHPMQFVAPPVPTEIYREMLLRIAVNLGWSFWFDSATGDYTSNEWIDHPWWDAPDFVDELNSL